LAAAVAHLDTQGMVAQEPLTIKVLVERHFLEAEAEAEAALDVEMQALEVE
jgi:hypothetical protein